MGVEVEVGARVRFRGFRVTRLEWRDCLVVIENVFIPTVS